MGCGCSIPVQSTDNSLLNEPLDCNLNYIDSSSMEYEQLNTLFKRASSILKTFEEYREQIVDKFDSIVYKTGACIFTKPTIVHCVNSIWYKISLEYDCNISQANITYVEDPPYLSMRLAPQVSEDTKKIVTLLEEYVTYLRSIKTSMKQLENALAELIYLINEVTFPINNQRCYVNKMKITKGVRMFPELTQFYRQLLQMFRYEVYMCCKRKDEYSDKINKVAKIAKDKGCKNIYQVAEMYKVAMKVYPEDFKGEAMLKSEEAGRKKYLDIIHEKEKKKKQVQYVTFEQEVENKSII